MSYKIKLTEEYIAKQDNLDRALSTVGKNDILEIWGRSRDWQLDYYKDLCFRQAIEGGTSLTKKQLRIAIAKLFIVDVKLAALSLYNGNNYSGYEDLFALNKKMNPFKKKEVSND